MTVLRMESPPGSGIWIPVAVGAQGPEGPQGPKGDPGTSISIAGSGHWVDIADIQDATTGTLYILIAPAEGAPEFQGEPALAGDGIMWDGDSWINVGPLRGPAGPGADPEEVSFAFHQGTPATEWVINHGLAFRPNITVVDSAGDQVEGDVTYNSPTTVTVSFSAAFSGTAYLS